MRPIAIVGLCAWLCAGAAPPLAASCAAATPGSVQVAAWRVLRLAGGGDSSDGLFGANSGELLDPDADFVEEDIRKPRTVTFDGDGDGPPAGQPRSGAPGKVQFHGEPDPDLAVPHRRRQSQPAASTPEQPVADDKERLVVCCLPPDASGRAHGCAAESS